MKPVRPLSPPMEHVRPESAFAQWAEDWVRVRASSYRKLATALGLGAPNAVQRIVTGQRPLQRDVWLAMLAQWDLSALERDYAEKMWELDKAPTHAAKEKIWDSMTALRRQADVCVLDEQQYAFFRNWYMPVIWELACHPEYDSPEWIAARVRPRLDLRRVRSSLETLKDLGLLRPEPKGRWSRAQASLSTPSQVKGLAAARYHSDVLQLAEMSMDEWGADQRSLRSVMVGMSEKRLQELRGRLEEFWLELLASVPEDEPVERICQVSLQLYPYTAKLGAK